MFPELFLGKKQCHKQLAGGVIVLLCFQGVQAVMTLTLFLVLQAHNSDTSVRNNTHRAISLG